MCNIPGWSQGSLANIFAGYWKNDKECLDKDLKISAIIKDASEIPDIEDVSSLHLSVATDEPFKHWIELVAESNA